MATACTWTITLYLYVWGLDLRLNNINYSCWYFSSSVSHYTLVLNLWNTIQLKYHNQWVSYLWYTHLSQGLKPPILTVVSLWYFPLAFLEGHCLSSSPVVTSLHLDPAIWNPSAPSNKVASSSNTSFQSHWRYSTILFFLSSFSATLCLSAFSWAFFSTSLLAFWATCSAWCNFTASSSWARSRCSSLCLCYISCCCFLRTLALFCEMLEGMGEDIMIWKQEQKTSFSVYVLLT